MDLLENYLAAVRRNLPAAQAQDIVSEIRVELLDRAEEEEATTGHVDWNGLLRQFGHPLVVAARYRQQQWLIGPEIYPFYVHFLKVITAIVLAVVVAIAAVKVGVRGGEPGALLAGFLGSVWSAAAATVGSVTILFVIFERFSNGKALEAANWQPMELPDVLDPQPSVAGSIFEVAAGALFLLWWIGAIPTPALAWADFRLEAAAIWDQLFWPVTALLAVRLIHNLIQWLRPRWKALRGVLGIGTAIGGLAIAAAVYRAGRWIEVVPTNMNAEQAAGLQASLDLALGIAVVVVMIVWTFGIFMELWRLARSLRETPAAPVQV
jgi:hypothetical protein